MGPGEAYKRLCRNIFSKILSKKFVTRKSDFCPLQGQKLATCFIFVHVVKVNGFHFIPNSTVLVQGIWISAIVKSKCMPHKKTVILNVGARTLDANEPASRTDVVLWSDQSLVLA